METTLRPLTPKNLDFVVRCLQDPLIYKWLDFGGGRQCLTVPELRVFMTSPINFVRVVHVPDGQPHAFFCFQGLTGGFGTAMLWGVRAIVRPPFRSRADYETRRILQVGFEELGLHSVNTWAVECNHVSLKVIRRVGFREIGRQRSCHVIDGVRYDRIHFDMLAKEYFLEERSHFNQHERSRSLNAKTT
jgi:hypothetical protein